jgi:hypothetical protein
MDRYWLSTVTYARARGCEGELSEVAAWVPVPDLTIWLTLDEAERRRRLTHRGMTPEDRETLVPEFAASVLAAACGQHGRLGVDVFVDLTGADELGCVERVVQAVARSCVSPRSCSAAHVPAGGAPVGSPWESRTLPPEYSRR